MSRPLTPASRAADLLDLMTLDEKVYQLSAIMPTGLFGPDGPIAAELDARLGLGIGHISGGASLTFGSPVSLAAAVNAVQRYLVTRTRLQIPAIIHNEALNGVAAPDFTVFPTGIALAATWDPAAIAEMADIIRRQLRSVGFLQALSPVMDVARDARWGRVHETYGEEPCLVAACSVAYTRGIQGDDLAQGVIATAKHFLGYAMGEGGQNMAAAQLSTREIYEVYAKPFEAASRLASLASVMNSYGALDGIPVGISAGILTDLLRGKLGFNGAVVSDYMTLQGVHERQQAAGSIQEAGVLALEAGLDVELPQVAGFGPLLAEAVRSGRLNQATVDQAVLRVLTSKYELGLFDSPYVAEDPITITQTAHLGTELAGQLAEESVTLLTNNGVLPLGPEVRRIAVVGPHADSVGVHFPGYTWPATLAMIRGLVTGEHANMAGIEREDSPLSPAAVAAMLAGIGPSLAQDPEDYIRASYPTRSLAEALGDLLPDSEIITAPGVGIMPDEPQDLAAALAAAEAADVVIAAVGGRSGSFGADLTEGEGSDSANIDLAVHQAALVQAVVATGVPTVVVVYSGRPLGLAAIADGPAGMVYGYFGGQAGGEAMARVLTGTANPSGRLPYSLPRHSGQVPIYQGQPTGSGAARPAADIYRGYLDLPTTPLFAFGHGLSYTNFHYEDLCLSPATVPADGRVTVSLRVTNTGSRSGSEVVQLYVHDTATGVTRPGQELAGFARLTLAPGAAATVSFELELAQLAYLGRSGDLILEAGDIEVRVGAASDDIRLRGTLVVDGPTVEFPHRTTFWAQATVAPLAAGGND